MREIESKFGRSDKRSLLVDVITQNLTEGIVEDMSTGMVVSDGPATEFIVGADDFVSDFELSFF